MTEEWREIPGWEGFYAVSNDGRVKSLARTCQRGSGPFRVRERLLALSIHTDGYHVVYLKRGTEKRVQARVHRLVLEAFVGPCPEGMEGCHNDGDKLNNRLDNLRWDTRSANSRDAVKHGAHPMSRKTHCKWGHPFNVLNTYYGGGKRECRTCRLAAKRRYNNRKKAAA